MPSITPGGGGSRVGGEARLVGGGPIRAADCVGGVIMGGMGGAAGAGGAVRAAAMRLALTGMTTWLPKMGSGLMALAERLWTCINKADGGRRRSPASRYGRGPRRAESKTWGVTRRGSWRALVDAAVRHLGDGNEATLLQPRQPCSEVWDESDCWRGRRELAHCGPALPQAKSHKGRARLACKGAWNSNEAARPKGAPRARSSSRAKVP